MQRLLPLGLSLVLLSACSLFGGTTGGSSAQSSSEASLPETHNVSFRGTVEQSGSRYLLRLHDGRSVELSSDYLSLEEYIGLEIDAFGSVRPLSNDAGMAMRVESVTLLSAATSSSSVPESSSSSSEDAMAGSFSSAATAPVVSSKAQIPASSRASVPSSSAAPASTAPVTTLSPAMDIKVKAMAKEDIAAGRWTQQYCSSHIGFCVAVHKNWWFTSFGTAASALWHVEVSNGEIAGLGDGPLAVNLMTGSVETVGASDGAVVEKDGIVYAYRAWKDNTHFVVSAPAALRAAASYMAQSIASYAPPQ